MKTISQYKEDIKALMKKSADIDAQCVNENREPTESELTIKNELLDTAEEFRRIVQTQERQERMNNALAQTDGPETLPRTTTNSRTTAPKRDKDRFNSFGEQMAAVMHAGIPGGNVDPRLFNAATGLNETTPSDGGFLIQTDFSTELLQEVYNTGVLSSRCRRQPLSGGSNSIKINGVDETSRASSRYGGIVGYWEDEAGEKTASKPKFRKIELNLKKLIGLCYLTDELMEDAAGLESFVRTAFAGEFGFLVDEAIYNGTGAGQPLGFMNTGSLVTVSKETGQAAATILPENIDNMYARRFAGQTSNYVWLYNQMIEPQLSKMAYSIGTGGSLVYTPPGGMNSAPYGMIKGLPAIAVEQAAVLGTAGDIVLANLQNGYVLAEKGGIKTDMSIHVRFVYDEQVFRFVLRIDGQPVRATALTPFKGGASATQSHFVALATRA